jgi:hypothetical protein
MRGGDWVKQTIILVIVLLLVKHVLFDGPLNSSNENRGMHAALHGTATTVILLATTTVMSAPIILGVVDGAVHYVVDKFKRNVFVNKYKHSGTVTKTEYWFFTILDQLLHMLTYAFIIIILKKWR